MTSLALLDRLMKVLKECSDERYQDMEKSHVEARKWKAEGDMYGWNFHEGMASGMNWADIIYRRLGREIDVLIQTESLPVSPTREELRHAILEQNTGIGRLDGDEMCCWCRAYVKGSLIEPHKPECLWWRLLNEVTA